MPGIFHTKELAKMIKQGEWGDAVFYADSFAPFSRSGYQARLLVQFLMDFLALDSFARCGCVDSGIYFWNWLGCLHKKPVLDKYPCFAKLVEHIVNKRHDHARSLSFLLVHRIYGTINVLLLCAYFL